MSADVPARDRYSRLGSFRHRDFAIYWAGGFLSNSGTWLQNVAGSVYIFSLTGSPLMVGVLNFANFSPIFVFSLFGGVLSDRFERRKIVIVTQSLTMVVAAVLTLLTFADLTTPTILIAVTFLIGTSYAVAKPSLTALLPSLVPREEIAQATATNTLQFIIGQIVGSSLAALILAIASPAWAFGVNTLTFTAIIAAMLLIHPRESASQKARGGGVRSLMEGLAFVRSQQAMSAILIAVVLTNTSVEALRTLAPSFATRILGQSESAAGIIVASYSVGSIIALLIFGWAKCRMPLWRLAAIGFLLQGVGTVLFALSPIYPLSLAAAVPIGLGFSFLTPILNAKLQELAPEHLRGRVMSTFAMAHLGMRPLSALSAGALASVLGGRAAMLSFTVLAGVGLWTLRAASRASPESASDEGDDRSHPVAASAKSGQLPIEQTRRNV